MEITLSGKIAIELYHQITTILQAPDENPLSFLIRAVYLRQKVLFFSKKLSGSKDEA